MNGPILSDQSPLLAQNYSKFVKSELFDLAEDKVGC